MTSSSLKTNEEDNNDSTSAHGSNVTNRDSRENVDSNLVRVECYNKLEDRTKKRFIQFVEQFQAKFNNRKPDYIVAAPGRVNLIGDHIDYHGFSVLPMGIERQIWLGCSISNNQNGPDINLKNVESNLHSDWSGNHSFKYAPDLSRSCEWQNYFLCGYQGILATEVLNVKPRDLLDFTQNINSIKDSYTFGDRMDQVNSSILNCDLPKISVLVQSDIPQAAGLSSSSAFVCASAVITQLLLHNRSDGEHPSISTKLTAENCSCYEHLIGTHGGGMDQAVVMTANEGYAKYVGFVPQLRCENVRLPDNIAWLVSHCGVTYPKAATTGFNTRVLETKLGAAFIAQYYNSSRSSNNNRIPIDSSITLGKVKQEFFQDWSTQNIVDHLRRDIFQHTNDFTVDDICKRLDLTRDQLVNRFQVTEKFLIDALGGRLKLLDRCEHVFEEAERVEKFKSICDTTTEIRLLGQLMSQSHNSLRDKYQCSHPALDRLVSVALEAGALGSRLTGAGWGGCIVTLVESSKCKTVFERLEQSSKFTFVTKPQSGCRIILANE